jgi:iron(III) transport system ATP-binding protein
VALARTIAIEPKLLLLDEPLSNLDAKLRVEVRRELRAMQKRLGLTTVIVTHDQEEANTICDRVAVMNAGKIQQIGTPTDLYERPANLFVAQFLGTANVIEGDVISRDGERTFATRSGQHLRVPAGSEIAQDARLVFRPQHAALATDLPLTPDGHSLQGVIADREFLGSTVRYGVRTGEIDLWVDAPFTSGAQLLAIGRPVAVSIDLDLARWIAT